MHAPDRRRCRRSSTIVHPEPCTAHSRRSGCREPAARELGAERALHNFDHSRDPVNVGPQPVVNRPFAPSHVDRPRCLHAVVAQLVDSPCVQARDPDPDPSGLFADFIATVQPSDFCGSFIIGFGSSPSRRGPLRHLVMTYGRPADLPVPEQRACVHARFYDHAGSPECLR